MKEARADLDFNQYIFISANVLIIRNIFRYVSIAQIGNIYTCRKSSFYREFIGSGEFLSGQAGVELWRLLLLFFFVS